MSQTRYCSTCGALLTEGAAICGECGARYQASPYERRATDAPGAWSQAPRPRSRDLGAQEEQAQDDGIELISRESLTPKQPGATALRSQEQYDQVMVTQPPPNQNGPGASFGQPSAPGSPAPASAFDAPISGGIPEMEPPLDGCAPASPVKRLLASLLDGVIATLVLIPLIIGIVLLATQDPITLLPQILVGVGAALPAAYTVLMIWLSGSRGITLGKVILGLRITRASEGGNIGFLRALGRWALYGVIPLIMALSIFIDPKKQLRGFHDRVIDSVVVDVKSGRNPLQPRPDDFERAGAEHYLGSSSVAVSTHENLLTEPGAAWRNESQGASAGQQSASGAWGADQQAAGSPYTSPVSSSSSAPGAPIGASPWSSASSAPAQETHADAASSSSDGVWAPPPVEPVGQSSWDQQAPPQQSWDQQAPPQQQQPWDQHESFSPPQQVDPQWGQSQSAPLGQPWDQSQNPAAPAPEQPQDQSAAQAWGPPPVAPEAQRPPAPSHGDPLQQYGAPAAQSFQDAHPPSPAPVHPADAGAGGWSQGATGQDQAAAPDELTSDAWNAAGSEVDEQTRMSVPEESIEDLEQTRISVASLPVVKTIRLIADDGTERRVEKAVVIGRNPTAPGDEVLFVLKDDTRSVSKTHLRIDGTGEDITVTDLGSTNGSTILREDGTRENLVPDSAVVLPLGAKVTLGDRTLFVEKEQ